MKKTLLVNALYYPNVGGVENSLHAIALELREKGYTVDIVCSDLNQRSQPRLPREEILHCATVRRYEYRPGIAGYIKQIRECKGIIEKMSRPSGYDLVIARSHISVISCFLAGERKMAYVVPSVPMFQEFSRVRWTSAKDVLKYLANSVGQTSAFLMAKKTYVFSKAMRAQVKKASFGVVKPLLVRPGIDQTRFTVSKTQRMATRRKLKIRSDKKVLLCIGRFSYVKRFDLALGALRYLDSSYVVLFVGEGAERSEYARLVDDLELGERVIFVGKSHVPEDYYNAADAFLMTSRYEAFGQTLLEAVSSGLRIVAFSQSSGVDTATEEVFYGFPELITFVDLLSERALAEGIEKAFVWLDRGGLEGAKASLLENYSWRSLTEHLERGLD